MNALRLHRLIAVVATALAVAAASPARTSPPSPPPVFPYGVSWYPEQEPEEGWAADLRQMREAHITFVRLGEFAWSRMEPREGRYDFTWLDRAIALAKKMESASCSARQRPARLRG